MDGYRNEMKIVMAAVEKKVHGRAPSLYYCLRDIIPFTFTLNIITDVQLSITRVENHVVDAKADDAQARGGYFLVFTAQFSLPRQTTQRVNPN
jgi:hypothetical protein